MDLKLNFCGDISNVRNGLDILLPRLGVIESDEGIEVELSSASDKLRVKKTDSGYMIGFSFAAECFRGLALLCDAIKNDKDIYVREKRKFKTSGTMLDVSRGAVFKKEVIFDLLERSALMGLDMFMLYTEDTYELEKYPMFGYMKGAYTKEELKEIDDHANKLGIELIPCIQTLAHLKTYLRWPEAKRFKDTSDVLLVGAEETYIFIEEMFKTCRECFRTDRIHIGFDEAFGIGAGKYKDLNGEKPISEIMLLHLEKVCALSDKYGFNPMIWSDMFFRMSGQTGEYDLAAMIPPNLAKDLPKNIEMVYWDYCMEDRVVTDTVIKMHREMQRPVVFAGGFWTWNRLAPGFKKSYISSREQLSSCAVNGVDTVILTVWDNQYAALSLYSILPGLQMWAEQSYNPEADLELIAERFKACTGYDFEEWQNLYPDDFTDEELKKFRSKNAYCINSATQHFFKDILNPIADKTLEAYDFKAKYEKLREDIKNFSCEDMDFLFKRFSCLYEIIYIKSDFGKRLREAYCAEDREKLAGLLTELERLCSLYREFHSIERDSWFRFAKPFGFNTYDMLLGSVVGRTETALYRLREYLSGSIDSLPECENDTFKYHDIEEPLMEVAIPTSLMRVV